MEENHTNDSTKAILLTTDGQVLGNAQPNPNAVSVRVTNQAQPQQAPPQKPPSQPQRPEQQKSQFSIMLAEAIKNSTYPEVPKLKVEIDEIKKQRAGIISRIKDTRRRLNYKEAESIAVAKLLLIEKTKAQSGEKRNKIGYLKKLKNRLEFKISTEATSLAAEKTLVRQIEDVNKELDEAYKAVRLERKSDFVKKDVEQYKQQLTELEGKIEEMDKRLDELYDKLRKILGINRSREEATRPKRKPAQQVQGPQQEINLEDIAVIKKKKKADVQKDSA